MKKFILLLSIIILFAFNVSKGCDNMAITRGVNESIIDYRARLAAAGETTSGSSGEIAPTEHIIGVVPTLPEEHTVTYDPNAEMLAYIQQQVEAQKASRMAGFESSRNTALSSLSGEEASIKPGYYDKRNQAAAASDVGKMNFAQYMAGRGIQGAAGAMPEIYASNALQGQVGSLNRQEQADISDIARRRTGIETNYASDVASANADIESNALEQYITQMNADRSFALQESGTTGTYNNNPTLAKQQIDYSQSQQERDNYAATAGQYSADFAAEQNNILGNGDPTDDWKADILGAARQNKLQSQAEAQAATMAAASVEEQQQYKNALEIWKTNGTATAEIAGILGVPEGSKTADFNIDSINAATSRINANKPSGSNEPSANDLVTAAIQDLGTPDQTSGYDGSPTSAYDELRANSNEWIAYFGGDINKYNQVVAYYKDLAGV